MTLRATAALFLVFAVPSAAFAKEEKRDDVFRYGRELMFVVSYGARQSQAIELRCSQEPNGDIECEGTQLLVTQAKKAGECTVSQWPVRGLSMARTGSGRWRALLPSALCTNFALVYVLERQGKYRWQLTIESVKTGEPQDALEAQCSSSSFPTRTVYVQDHENTPEPVEMGCSKVRLMP